MRISDWGSDVCSSDLTSGETCGTLLLLALLAAASVVDARTCVIPAIINGFLVAGGIVTALTGPGIAMIALAAAAYLLLAVIARLAAWLSSTTRSEEHTSELQSLMRNSYAVFCLKKKNTMQT